MSTTGNEYEQPGVNHPAREDADGVAPTDADALRDPDSLGDADGGAVREGDPTGEATGHESAQSGAGASSDTESDASADHHGQDGGRDTLTVGQTQAAHGGEAEQNRPAMSQNNASDQEKVAGLVAQTRNDVVHLGRDEVVRVLKQRLDQTGISISDDELQRRADEVVGS